MTHIKIFQMTLIATMAALLLCCDKECDTLPAPMECKPIFYNPDSVALLLNNDNILEIGNAYYHIYDSINYSADIHIPISQGVSVEGDCILIPFMREGRLSIRFIWDVTHSDGATGLPVVTLMMFGPSLNINPKFGYGVWRYDLTPVKSLLGKEHCEVLIHLKFYRAPNNDRAVTYAFDGCE